MGSTKTCDLFNSVSSAVTIAIEVTTYPYTCTEGGRRCKLLLLLLLLLVLPLPLVVVGVLVLSPVGTRRHVLVLW
jgi:hypothetical protein